MSDPKAPLLSLSDVAKHFTTRSGFGRRNTVRAVDGVSLEITRGETLGVVGETGSGKTTLIRCASRLCGLTRGRVQFDDLDITNLTQSEMRPIRRRMQLVFQDPYGSLNPRHRVGSIIGEPLEVHGMASGLEKRKRVAEIMELVGLDPGTTDRYPAEFSGGQRQRINIARAMALGPELVVCDEPVSALDVSIRAQILNLLKDMQRELGLTYLFVSHDLSVIRYMSDRVAVMEKGKVVEVGATEELFAAPRHPYTKSLLTSVPDLR